MKALNVVIEGSPNSVLCQMDKDIEDKWTACRAANGIMTFLDMMGNLLYVPAIKVLIIVAVEVQEEVVKKTVADNTRRLSST